ncbi:hypothetical protein GQR58_012394 [Nymphon striatum]|nr:hypothetical protein GQR58_012394 [Nymphon striatum]
MAIMSTDSVSTEINVVALQQINLILLWTSTPLICLLFLNLNFASLDSESKRSPFHSFLILLCFTIVTISLPPFRRRPGGTQQGTLRHLSYNHSSELNTNLIESGVPITEKI